MTAKPDLSKYLALESAKTALDALLARHAEELAEAEAKVSREQIALGLGPYVPPGAPKKPMMAKVKAEQHAEVRAEAIKRGWYHESGRKKGKPDVERVRLHRKAEKLGISVETLAKREAEARLKKISEKLKVRRLKR